MVDDKEIKTTISPFTIRKGEIKVFDGKDGYVSMNQIIQKINQGIINDVHFKILEIINKYEFVTSRQIYQLLTLDNIDIKNQDKVTSKLEQLVKNKIITRYYFTSSEGKGIYRIYCLEKMGKYLLNSREIECKWQPTDNAKPVSMIKEKLAGNQLIIAYQRKVKNLSGFELKPVITAKLNSKTFKPVLKASIKIKNTNLDLIYEAIRREDNWENKLVERMRLWKDFYENFVPGDSGLLRLPQLIFICEDEKHMAEVFKTLIINKCTVDNVKFYYTTDMQQNLEELNKSFFEFVEESGKYKMKNLDIKILG